MSSDTHPLGSFVGKYRIEALLGRGGMGEVYRAFDPSLDRTVALKVIRPEAAEAMALSRFLREGKAAARLRHPGIVAVYDLGEAEGTTFLAMEYLEGEDLSALMRADSLSLPRKLDVLVQVLDALDYAHGKGVVHRDIKPSNVRVLPDGSVKLVDFGIARIAQADALTNTGSILGTPYYMSPEQLRGEPVDRRTDVYSTGVVAYKMLAGRRPFDGATLTEVILKIINEPPLPMERLRLGPAADAERIVSRSLEKRAGDRYASAGEMAADLRALLPAAGADAAEPSRTAVAAGTAPTVLITRTIHRPGGRSRLLWASAAALVLASLAGIFALARGPSAKSGDGAEGPRSPEAPVAPREPPGAPPVIPAAGASPSVAPTAAGREDATGRRRVCFEAAAGSEDDAAAVRSALRDLLRERGYREAEACRDGILSLGVAARVTIRPSPFESSSALTADYVGRLELDADGTDFQGHVMEFGESVVRAAAVRELAARMADHLGKTRPHR